MTNEELKPFITTMNDTLRIELIEQLIQNGCLTTCFELDGGVHCTYDSVGGEQVAAREQNTFREAIDKLAAQMVVKL